MEQSASAVVGGGGGGVDSREGYGSKRLQLHPLRLGDGVGRVAQHGVRTDLRLHVVWGRVIAWSVSEMPMRS